MKIADIDTYTRSLDCVHCGLCLPACPTYDVLGLETDSPRGRIYLMRALAEGRVERPEDIRVHLDQCLGCRACETACPSGVQYGRLLEEVRCETEKATPTRGLGARLRRFVLARIVAHQRRLRLAVAAAAALQAIGLDRLAGRLGLLPATFASWRPRIPDRRRRRPLSGTHMPAGTPRGRVALFTGCVMEPMFGDVNRATLEVLLANGFAVDIPATQRCCGALLLHNGQADAARDLARENIGAFSAAETVVVNSAGCGAAMREYGHTVGGDDAQAFSNRCRDVCEFLATEGLTATPRPYPHKVAYDDPCHLCHAQGVRTGPRELLRRVPELQLVEHDDPESCCGSAGIFNLVHHDLAADIGRNKARALAASGADCVATGNPGCMMQIEAHLRAVDAELRVVHPVELLLP